MRRIPFVISILTVSGALVSGPNQNGSRQSGHNSKLDKGLNDKFNNGQSNEKVRFMVQCDSPPSASENDDIIKS